MKIETVESLIAELQQYDPKMPVWAIMAVHPESPSLAAWPITTDRLKRLTCVATRFHAPAGTYPRVELLLMRNTQPPV